MDRQIPKQYITNYRKAMTGRSRKAAIKAFCLECVGYQYNEVAQCTDSGCPLYPYRPYKRASKPPKKQVPFKL